MAIVTGKRKDTKAENDGREEEKSRHDSDGAPAGAKRTLRQRVGSPPVPASTPLTGSPSPNFHKRR